MTKENDGAATQGRVIPRNLSVGDLQANLMASRGLSELKHHSRVIIRTLEFATRSHATDPLPAYMAEGTFAIQYLLKEDDLIPDQVPGIGLVDDAILIKRVLCRKSLNSCGRKLSPSIVS